MALVAVVIEAEVLEMVSEATVEAEVATEASVKETELPDELVGVVERDETTHMNQLSPQKSFREHLTYFPDALSITVHWVSPLSPHL